MQRPEKILGTTGGRSQQIHSLTHSLTKSYRVAQTDQRTRPPVPSKANPKPKLNRGGENQLCIILSIDICGRQSLFGALTLYSSLPLPARPSAILSFSLIHSLFIRMCVCFCVQHFFTASLFRTPSLSGISLFACSPLHTSALATSAILLWIIAKRINLNVGKGAQHRINTALWQKIASQICVCTPKA